MKKIDTCAGEFESKTPYMYSTYGSSDLSTCESEPTNKQKVIILGSGPNRIGIGYTNRRYCNRTTGGGTTPGGGWGLPHTPHPYLT